jgi:uncharacterized protein (DUF488 family)
VAPRKVFTVGHSTHPIEEFIRMLENNDVQRVVDVRTIPASRRNPQFSEPALGMSLQEAGISYGRIPALGGLRHTPATTPTINGAWRNQSFRSYADYMQTPEFATGIDELVAIANAQVVAVMCAEAVPWRCHRSLIADALLARHITVDHIMSATDTRPHRMTDFARTRGQQVWYPPESP